MAGEIFFGIIIDNILGELKNFVLQDKKFSSSKIKLII